MKKGSLLTALIALNFLVTALFTSGTKAAAQTISLAPTTATIGHAVVDTLGDFGGGISDPDNALELDGQMSGFDPSTAGPGPDGGDSYLFLDYDKNGICPEAEITSVMVHVYWSQSEDQIQNDVTAALYIPTTPNTLETSYTPPSTFTQLDLTFGGLINSAYLAGGTYGGNPPSSITHEYSTAQIIPTLAQLTDPDARIMVTIGEEQGNVTGELDYTYLEVQYDDEACNIDHLPVTTSTDAPVTPKTGQVASLIILLAILGALFVTIIKATRHLKSKH